MTNFTVFLIRGGDLVGDDEATYRVLDSGVLEVFDDTKKRKVTFGPAAWSHVEESTDYDV